METPNTASRIYHERISQCEVPNGRTCVRLHIRLSERGIFKRSTVIFGEPVTVRSIQAEEAILNTVDAKQTITQHQVTDFKRSAAKPGRLFPKVR